MVGRTPAFPRPNVCHDGSATVGRWGGKQDVFHPMQQEGGGSLGWDQKDPPPPPPPPPSRLTSAPTQMWCVPDRLTDSFIIFVTRSEEIKQHLNCLEPRPNIITVLSSSPKQERFDNTELGDTRGLNFNHFLSFANPESSYFPSELNRTFTEPDPSTAPCAAAAAGASAEF